MIATGWRGLFVTGVVAGLMLIVLQGCLTMPPLVNIEVNAGDATATATYAPGAQQEAPTGAPRAPISAGSAEIAPAPGAKPTSGSAPDAQETPQPAGPADPMTAILDWLKPTPPDGRTAADRTESDCTLPDAYQLANDADRAEFLEQACLLGDSK